MISISFELECNMKSKCSTHRRTRHLVIDSLGIKVECVPHNTQYGTAFTIAITVRRQKRHDIRPSCNYAFSICRTKENEHY